MNTEKINRSLAEEKNTLSRIIGLPYYSAEAFMNDANRYIKAIKDRRMICSIKSVSRSGMSRTMTFKAVVRNKYDGKYYLSNFNGLFVALGFRQSKNKDGFIIGGCGMDMVFHTNYTIIHRLHRLGFITKKQCAELAQETPSIV